MSLFPRSRSRSRARARCGRPVRRLRCGSIPGALAFCVLLFLASPVFSRSQEVGKGLSKEQVITLLKNDPAPRVQYLVNKYGIGFYLTPEIENELRDAGGTPALMDLIRKLAPAKPAEVKPPAPPTLVIHAKPGESEVYVDDEPRGQTGADGTLKLGNLTPGSHKLRISLLGYRSYEGAIDLAAGETNTVMAELQPIPPPAPPKEEAPAKTIEAPAIQKPRGDPNDPLTSHDAGIYYLQQTAGARQLIQLEEAPPASRSIQTGRRSGALGAALPGFGGYSGAKWKSMIYGEKARIRVDPGRPVFYFYFRATESEANPYGVATDAFRHASTPSGFILVRLQTHKNLREIPAKGSVSAAVDEKDTVAFNYESVATGIYKAQLKSDLAPGEYAFLYGGVLQYTMQTWLFDFGIDKSR